MKKLIPLILSGALLLGTAACGGGTSTTPEGSTPPAEGGSEASDVKIGILIPGSLFKESYLKRRLHPKNLSRALEDSATMLDGAIPWASGAVYMSGVLGVSAFEYVPWMVFNYSSVFIGLACAMLGIGIVKISAEDAKERLATSQMDTVLIEETPEPVQA